MKIAWAIGSALALVVAIALVQTYLHPAPNVGAAGPAALAGSPATSFTLQRVGGGVLSLNALRGKVVILNLWATWCPPCREEMPDLERLYRTQRDRGLVIVGADQGEADATIAAFATALHITYPLLADRQQQYGRVYAALGLPTTIIIGRDGRIVRGIDGIVSFEQARTAVDPLLRQ